MYINIKFYLFIIIFLFNTKKLIYSTNRVIDSELAHHILDENS